MDLVLKDLIAKNKQLKNIVVLTGAGISAESGIKTFRDADGLWENHRIEDVASLLAFKKDPNLVHNFYNLRRAQLKEVEPNAAHFALAKLEKHCSNLTIITQNVDDLHERAGNQNLLHMHGELRKIREIATGKITPWLEDVAEDDYLRVRPDIVWFGESIKYPEEIQQALENCDLYLCIGTSNNVYPAAGFIQSVRGHKTLCVELNLEETSLSYAYDYNYYGPATQKVVEFVDTILTRLSVNN